MDINKTIENKEKKVKAIKSEINKIKSQMQTLNRNGSLLEDELLKELGGISALEELLKPVEPVKKVEDTQELLKK